MSDPEQGIETVLPHQESDASTEAASAKIWSIYVGEAEKYDKALVESWRSNMDSILIFAGLYSASLTAFVIESYKTLTPDSGDLSHQVLTQISLQILAASEGTTFTPAPTPTFVVPTAALICNALWFISPGLSLSCALIATLVEQWSREFLHRTDMRSSPILRARIFSYLYYGLKRFDMHLVVCAIPLLLHISLLFFFAGLVAFLLPINRLVMIISAATLGLVALIYATFTVLPLYSLDCPYRTPISGALWRIISSLRTLFTRPQNTPASGETMVDTVFRNATSPSTSRDRRDKQALCWTLKSLSDDAELEPFLEAIPDLLYNSQGRRYRYDDHIRAVSTCDGNLHTRMEAFLLGCASELMMQRQLICLKALWSIASIAQSDSCHQQPLQSFDLDLLALPWLSASTPYDRREAVRNLLPSVRALVKWSKYCAYIGRVSEVQQKLSKYSAALSAGRSPTVDGILAGLREMRNLLTPFLPVCAHQHMNLDRLLQDTPQLKDRTSTQLWIQDCSNCIIYFPDDLLYETLMEYLVKMANLFQVDRHGNPMYNTALVSEFRLTCATLQSKGCSPSPQVSASLTEAYQTLPKLPESDPIMRGLFANWVPTGSNLVRCLVVFIRHGGSDEILEYVFQHSPLVWIQFAHYVTEEPDGVDGQPIFVRATSSLCRRGLSLKCHQALSTAVFALERAPGSASTIWCIVLMRLDIIRALQTETPVTSDGIRELELHLTTLRLGRGIGSTMVSSSSGDLPISDRISLIIQEARIGILSDFLENYARLYARRSEVPNMDDALDYFGRIPLMTNSGVDEGVQLRLARSVYRLIDTTGYHAHIAWRVMYYVMPLLNSPASLAIMRKCEPRGTDLNEEDEEYPHASESGNPSAFT